MQMKGLDVLSTVRLTQPNDTLDIELDQLTSNSSSIQNEFYATLFFDMLNGTVTGEAGGAANPGLKLKMYDVDGAVVLESPVATLDWYETESNYISEAQLAYTGALVADTYIAETEVILVVNDGGSDKEIVVYKSTAFSLSSFASADVNGHKGVLISISNGALTARGNLTFTISKA